MNTILLQKILDILTEGLAHVGDFFKDLFVSDPQDGQVIAYDAETGHWVNKDATEVELDLTHTFEAQAIATLTDGAENVPMKTLIVDIVPKQASGTPTPDNPLPISGTDEVVITHTGANIVKPYSYTSTSTGIDFSYSNDSFTFSGTTSSNIRQPNSAYIRNNDGYTSIPSGTYTATLSSAVTGITLEVVDANDGSIISSGTTTTTFTINQSKKVYIRANIASGVTINNPVTIGYSLVVGSDTTYYQYTPTTHTIALPRTIYGGEVDVVSGQGNSNMALAENLTDWNSGSESASGYIRFVHSITGKKANYNIACNIFEVKSSLIPSEPTSEGISGYNNSSNIYISVASSRLTGDLSTNEGRRTAFNNWLANNTLEVCYELATPTPISTTTAVIKTQGGTESIWSDTGDVSGEYYTNTAEAVLALANITEDITSEVTTNTTDWSSLQYKVVKNNKVVTVYLYSATTTEHGSVELFSGLPKAAYNGPFLLFDTDNNAVVNAKVDTSGYLDVTLTAGGTVKGTITYVAK